MNILVVNGSPRGAHGNTEVLIRAFLEGAVSEGDTVNSIALKDKKIEHCKGCFTCWTTTPGICCQHDDMEQILNGGTSIDILVLGSPLYIYNFSGLMKDFMDRLLPMAQPFVDVQDGVSTHPSRYAHFKPKAIVLVSNSGFPEVSHFDGMKQVFRQSFGAASPMICCAGGAMLANPAIRSSINWYLQAVQEAGHQVAETGAINPETQSILDRPLVDDSAAYAERLNSHWRSLGLTRLP
ncbi:MAG: flavodoxin family protein [Armatimonadota bacterium]